MLAACAGLFATCGCSSSSSRPEQDSGPKQFLHIASIKASDGGNGELSLQHLIAPINGPTDVFFETTAPFPQSFTLDLDPSERQSLRTYALVTGNHGDHGTGSTRRMPRGWVLSGCDDGIKWVVLDRQKAQPPWQPSEERRFRLSSPASYKHLRLDLTEAPIEPILRVYGIRLYSN